MISLIRNKFDSTVNQMRPLSPVIRIKGNQRRPLTVFDHTFDVRKGVFSCSVTLSTLLIKPNISNNYSVLFIILFNFFFTTIIIVSNLAI